MGRFFFSLDGAGWQTYSLLSFVRHASQRYHLALRKETTVEVLLPPREALRDVVGTAHSPFRACGEELWTPHRPHGALGEVG
jgi:hypothetical protein